MIVRTVIRFSRCCTGWAPGSSAEGDIAPPIRDILRRQGNRGAVPGEVEGLDLDTRRPVVRSETVAQKASAQSASESWAGSAKRAPCESGHGPASRQLGGLRRRRRVGRRGIRARVLKSHELGHAQPDAMGPTWRPAVFGSRSPPVSPPAPSMRGSRDRQRCDAGWEAANGGRDALPAQAGEADGQSEMRVSSPKRGPTATRGRRSVRYSYSVRDQQPALALSESSAATTTTRSACEDRPLRRGGHR